MTLLGFSVIVFLLIQSHLVNLVFLIINYQFYLLDYWMYLSVQMLTKK